MIRSQLLSPSAPLSLISFAVYSEIELIDLYLDRGPLDTFIHLEPFTLSLELRLRKAISRRKLFATTPSTTPQITTMRPVYIALPARCMRTFVTSASLRSEPKILPRLQSDLKTALRAKNKPALSVIRSLQAEIINASKTAKPITTDASLYSLVQKQIKMASGAIEEFKAAKREDLVEKEQGQLDVLQQYADEIPKVAESEVDEIVKNIVESQKEGDKRTHGVVMGKAMGAFKGRPVNIEYVRTKIDEALGEASTK